MLDKKGFTVIELMISFSLSVVVIIFIFNVILTVKDLYIEDGVKTQLYIQQGNIQKSVEETIAGGLEGVSGCGTNCVSLTDIDGREHRLSFNVATNIITYDNITVKLIEGSKMGNMTVSNQKVAAITTSAPTLNDGVLQVKIPITHKTALGDFGFNLVIPYNSNTMSITLV